MASFVPWYGKKRSRIEEREREFLELLHAEATESRVGDAAEKIRIAHIRALKEQRQKFAPSEKNTAFYNRVEQSIRWWMDVPANAIIDGYRKRRMSSIVRRAAK